MRIYLDEDSASGTLIALLQRAGHDVQTPTDVGMLGEDDPVQLGHAVQDGRVFLTHNYDHFQKLHNLIMITAGHHPGILAIRKDNDPKKDLDDPGIVRAISKLLAAGMPIADNVHVLNHWR